MSTRSQMRILRWLCVFVWLGRSDDARANATEAEARKAFLEGVRHVERASWAEALDSFNRAESLRPHPVTQYNLALCRRALGEHLRAIDMLDMSLRGEELPSVTREQALALRTELMQLVAHVEIRVATEHVAVSVDGRPLDDRKDALLAGVLAPGPGREVSVGKHTVWLDPGEHTWIFARSGFIPHIERQIVKPGSRIENNTVTLQSIPSVLMVEANRPDARVSIDQHAFGLAPLRLLHAPGKVNIVVEKHGFDRFEVWSVLRPGEETKVVANLREEAAPITRKWWFYALLGTAAAGMGVTTYLLLQPKEDGGTLNWIVR